MTIRLQVKPSPDESFEWTHAAPSFVIGRAQDCPLCFAGNSGTSVSGRHARIETTTEGAFLSDLGSTNGTFLNDARIEGRVPLRVGDQIYLGKGGPRLEVLALEVDSRPAAAAPQPAPAAANAHTATTAVTAAPNESALAPPYQKSNTTQLRVQLDRQRQTMMVLVLALAGSLVAGIVYVAIPKRPPAVIGPVAPASAAPATTPDPGSPVPAPPPTPVPDPPAAPTPVPDAAVVWIGVELQGIAYPFGTGWAVEPKTVVTTAFAVTTLSDFYNTGEPLFIHCPQHRDRIEVDSLSIHPQYPRQHDNENGVDRHDVGVLRLRDPLPQVWARAAGGSCKGALTTCGFAVPRDEGGAPMKYLEPLLFESRQLSAASPFRSAPGGGFEALQLKETLSGGMEGSPVFNSQAEILGTMSFQGGFWHVIHHSELDGLLKSN